MTKLLKLSGLPDHTIIVSDRYWIEQNVRETKQDLILGKSTPEYQEKLRNSRRYIAEMETMDKYNIDGIVDDIVDDMDSCCEDWADQYGDSEAVEQLRKDLQKAYDKFWNMLTKIKANKVYSINKPVLIDL